MSESIHWFDRPFVTLLTDAIEHTYLATSISNPGSAQRLARSAIVNCAIAVESAANCCLAALPLTKKYFDRMERSLGTLDKFEHFFLLHRGTKFDRGCIEVQRVDELIDLRNEFVHPKSSQLPASREAQSKESFTVDFGRYEHLKLSRAFRNWNGDAALIVLRATVEFFNHFFLQQCQWAPKQVTDILLSSLTIDGNQTPSEVGDALDLIPKAKQLWNIDCRFLEIQPSTTCKVGSLTPNGSQ